MTNVNSPATLNLTRTCAIQVKCLQQGNGTWLPGGGTYVSGKRERYYVAYVFSMWFIMVERVGTKRKQCCGKKKNKNKNCTKIDG